MAILDRLMVAIGLDLARMSTVDIVWVAIGLGGQLLFMSRFLVQWIVSERQRASVIPVAFWYLSIGGGLTLLTYAIHKRDPVFILGQLTGVFIYARNLYFIHSGRSAQDRSAPRER